MEYITKKSFIHLCLAPKPYLYCLLLLSFILLSENLQNIETNMWRAHPGTAPAGSGGMCQW